VTFEQMWRDLAPIGRSTVTGGYFRQPFTPAERELRAWFAQEAAARDLELESDGLGNQMAWWRPTRPEGGRVTEPPGVLLGSHLDSVLDGGAFDGPLGIVSAFAAIDLLRDRGFAPNRPIGVGAFVEEEGSRFPRACLGSQLATGSLAWETARELRDAQGVFLPDALAAAGLPGLDESPPLSVAGLHCFVELHVEQGRDLVDRDRAIAVASGIWPHGRYRFDFTGEANHAGTTRLQDRHDPMLTYAMTALAANKQARLGNARATFGRVETTPNGTNAVPSAVTAWLDARCETESELATLVAGIERQATERAERDGTKVGVTAESVSAAVTFEATLASVIATGHPHAAGHLEDWPIIATQAGHDAGSLAAAGVPTAMLFVRNPTGVSHSPAEHADLADCLAGIEALAETVSRLAS
jgi:N-carbamoyl-L-amino-acid hydrolase